MIESMGSKNGIWENTSLGALFLEEGKGRSFEAGEEIPEENRTAVDERTTPWQMFRRVIEQVISSSFYPNQVSFYRSVNSVFIEK